MLIGRVIVAMLVGGIVAGAAKRREMMVARTGHYGFLWTLPGVFASSIESRPLLGE